MSLFEQKYPNTIRTIIGLLNVPFQDDVVLECDTALSPVAIQLQTIPANYWSTQYKLYIIDKSNNASVNNITITAPLGYKINGATSVTISANGGSYLVRVISNTDYVGQYSTTASVGVAGHIIQDEAISLPQQPKLNFIGAGVTASDNVINLSTDVNIVGGYISLTNAQMLLLISGNAVVPSQNYIITDANYTNGGVIVQGTSTNTISVEGKGFFLNADYQIQGIYTGVVGFVANLGIWYSAPLPVVVGNVVIWNNEHYVNLTGAWGTEPKTDLVNWLLLSKSVTNGYILVCDFIKYNVKSNNVIYRADNLNNEVELFRASLTNFQWGRNEVVYNKVLEYSIMNCTNSYCKYEGNVLLGGSSLTDTTGGTDSAGRYVSNILKSSSQLTVTQNFGNVIFNELSNNSIIQITGLGIYNDANLRLNFLSNNSRMTIEVIGANGVVNTNNLMTFSTINCGLVNSVFSNNLISNTGALGFNTLFNIGELSHCEVSDGNSISFGNITTIYNNYQIRKSFSNWEQTLDCSDVLVYDLPTKTLTINGLFNYNGIFTTLNANGLIIEKIIGLPTNHISTFKPTDTEVTTYQHTLVSLAIANDLVCDVPSIGNALTGRANGCDYIEYKISGILNERTAIVILA